MVTSFSQNPLMTTMKANQVTALLSEAATVEQVAPKGAYIPKEALHQIGDLLFRAWQAALKYGDPRLDQLDELLSTPRLEQLNDPKNGPFVDRNQCGFTWQDMDEGQIHVIRQALKAMIE